MIPFLVFLVSGAAFWLAGRAGVTMFQGLGAVLRFAMGLMLLLTASAHWGARRADLIRIVPPAFSRPDRLVTLTGVLELLGAIGLFLRATAPAAGICLALLLLALFPANVHAARHGLTIGGRRVPGLPVRAAMQVVFVAALIGAALLK